MKVTRHTHAQGNPTRLVEAEEQVKRSAITQEHLSTSHIKKILNRLIFDTKIEEKVIPPDQEHSFPGRGPWYCTSPSQVHVYQHPPSHPMPLSTSLYPARFCFLTHTHALVPALALTNSIVHSLSFSIHVFCFVILFRSLPR